MGAETALRAERNSLERFLARLATALGHKVSGLVNALLHLLLILELAELSANSTNDNMFVLGQKLEGLEAPGTCRVILEVEGVDLQLGKELLCNDVVGTLGKMASTNEVATAQVYTSVEISRELADGIVVEGNVGIQEIVDSADVVRIFGPPLSELVGAKV